MKQVGQYLGALALALTVFSVLTFAQAPAAPPAGQAPGGRAGGPPPQPMSFFITSAGKGDGANYGGLAGADAHCQALATAAGRGAVTWRAYLSTQGPGAVNARDRIGNGPWYNARGQIIAMNLGELHGDTLDQARLGNRINKVAALNEKNTTVNGAGDMPNQHDILTGSTADGRAFTDGADHTCNNYTSNTHVEAPARGGGPPPAGAPAPPPGPSVQLGHHDRIGGANASWNSVHGSRGCSQPNLVATGGAGMLYCFAAQ